MANNNNSLEIVLKYFRYLKLVFIGVILIIFGVLIIVDTYKSPERLRSLLGITILLSTGYIFSKHRSQVNNGKK